MSQRKLTSERARGASEPSFESSPAARGSNGHRRRFILRQVGLAVAGGLSALLAAAAVASIWFLNYVEAGLQVVEIPGINQKEAGKPVNVLILGSDSRARLSRAEQIEKGIPARLGGERSDTIIFAHFDPRRTRAVLVHLPRDLRVEIPGHGEKKINEAFHLGGPELVVRTVQRFTGLPIHHYVEVDFLAFRNLVDALGGVRICVDRPMFDEKSKLRLPRAGCYRFGGEMALSFVRARHVEGDLIPDFARIARQQQFIRAVLNKLLSVRSLVRLPGLIRLASQNVTTDADLSGTDILYLGDKLRDLAEEDPTGARTVDLRVVPSVPRDIDGVSYVVAEQPQTGKLFRALETGRRLGAVGSVQVLTGVSPGVIEVWVLDAGAPEDAQETENLLRRSGFIVLGIREAPSRLHESAILFRPGAEDRAQTVGGFFPKLSRREARARVLAGADVAVVIAP